MNGDRRAYAKLLLAAVVLLSLVALGPAAIHSTAADQQSREVQAQQPPGPPHTISPHPNATREIWPYTSRRRSFDSATLPINVVVMAHPRLVRAVLVLRPEANWENQSRGLNGSGRVEGGDEGEVVPEFNATGLYWTEARGADRYTYVTAPSSQNGGDSSPGSEGGSSLRREGDSSAGSGEWLEERFQLHDGDYFGTRYHIRFYEVSDGENVWTPLQVHREHWDWFRLRHTVGSLPRAQHYVETQFYDQWYVADVQRRRFTDGGILNSDGWATVVDFQLPALFVRATPPVVLLAGLAAAGSASRWLSPAQRRRIRTFVADPPVDLHFMFLALSIASLPLLVRFGALAAEGSGFVNSPKVIAAMFYPILALGVPLVSFALSGGLEPEEAFIASLSGLGVGLLADYSYLGISTLPIEVVAHRAFLLVAVGILAASGAGWAGDRSMWRKALVLGGGLWIAGLLWPLFLM